MCHFWEEVWNLVGFQTTARCTAGAVSLGSRGRCFFTAAGTGDVVETEAKAGEGALLVDPLGAAVETRLRAAVMAGCKVSFGFGAESRDGAAAAAEEGSLPEQRIKIKFLQITWSRKK